MNVERPPMKDSEENIFKQMDVVASEMENLFYHLFSPRNPGKSVCQHAWSPLSDVYETADKLIVKMDLAGVTREDIGISLDEDRLVIRGVRREQAHAEVISYHQMEVNYGYFERVFHLRANIRQEDVTAHFEAGFLTITIKKAPPREEKSINISVE
jgi:HSP20 family protein